MKNTYFRIIHTSSFTFLLLAASILPVYSQDENEYASVEERRIHTSIEQELDNIEKQKTFLLIKEKELKTLEQNVDKKIAEVDRKVQELKELRGKIETLLAEKSAQEKKKIESLGKIYEKMDPEKAAFAISGLNEKLATDLLASMKVKAAAKILDRLNKQKAAQLSEKFSQIQLE